MATQSLKYLDTVIICKPYKAHIDQDNKIVTTAAYMCETAVHEIHDGVAKMVNEVIKLCWISKTYQLKKK